jgi:hypothetical protein
VPSSMRKNTCVTVAFGQRRVKLYSSDGPTLDKFAGAAGSNVPQVSMEFHHTYDLNCVG